MPRVVTYSMLLLSAAGVVASLVSLVVGFDADVAFELRVIKILFVIMFVTGFPTNLLAEKLAPKLRDRLLWKGVFRGCPRWMRIGLRIFLVLVFLASLALDFGRHLRGIFIFFAGFYSISFCVTYSFLHAIPAARSDKVDPDLRHRA
jgi:hypothetical protein